MPHEGHPGHEDDGADADRQGPSDDRIELVSVGIDIGSSTTHLAFSRIRLERVDAAYVVTGRELLYESPIIFTPYRDGETIDARALDAFVGASYAGAGLRRGEIDTGALILTGLAARRANARAIGQVFAAEAGRFVAVSAGDALEATLAAQGSGAVARSREVAGAVLNIDVGGGTTKFARCRDGRIEQVTALDAGARLVITDDAGRIARIEPAGSVYARHAGRDLARGDTLTAPEMDAIARAIAARIKEAAGFAAVSEETRSLLRLPPLADDERPARVVFSGGVSEFIHGATAGSFGDLGPALARHLRETFASLGAVVEPPRAAIRATVIGASQYTMRLSGSTIFIAPAGAVPIRDVPVIAPGFSLSDDELDSAAIAGAIGDTRARLDLGTAARAIAVAFDWRGSASFGRLRDFCAGLRAGLADIIAAGRPVILVNDGDVGGLLGHHLSEEMRLGVAVVSIDGIRLGEFDFIDIGAPVRIGGAVPVVIKSLVFPTPSGATPAVSESATPPR